MSEKFTKTQTALLIALAVCLAFTGFFVGKGNFPGTVISIFTIGLLRYGLGLINMNSQTILMIIGAILIIVVMLPNIAAARNAKKSMKRASAT